MEKMPTTEIVTTFLKKNSLGGLFTGAYNGYVIVRPDHPWYGLHYDEVRIDIHGGLTSCCFCQEVDWPEVPDYLKEDGYIFGFDTMHYGDTSIKWNKETVQQETDRMRWQFIEAYIKKMRDDNRNECRDCLQDSHGEER